MSRHARKVRCVLSQFALLALLAAPLAAQQSAVADAIVALEQARGAALVRGDTTVLSAMLAGEFVEISRLGQLRPRAANLIDITSGRLKLLTIKYDSLVVREYADIAVLTGIAENTGTFSGMPFAGRVRYSRIFVRRDGRWQAVLMQHTSMQ